MHLCALTSALAPPLAQELLSAAALQADLRTPLSQVDLTFSVLFMIDCCLNFRTAYVGEPVLHGQVACGLNEHRQGRSCLPSQATLLMRRLWWHQPGGR